MEKQIDEQLKEEIEEGQLKEDIAEIKEEENLEILNEVDLEEKTKKQEVIEAPKIGNGKYIEGIGRRKEAVARVRIWDNNTSETLPIYVNGRLYTNYFPALYLQKTVDAPLRKLRLLNQYLVTVQAKGGGLHGQADAIKLGLARALVKLNPEWRPKLKKAGFLTRDSREIERKKYGLKKARKAPQWHKR